MEDGLPQGSPLLVLLYVIYNSSLLINNLLTPDSEKISLGFIDDVTHLVAGDTETSRSRATIWRIHPPAPKRSLMARAVVRPKTPIQKPP
ncbi:hypothetical protein CROQUDRAFT_93313 [Cronartium quercuum f. sp. fusiforme G11]|uniref:Reverse transcriptase domain-containing protein n=1 Tax=Cronartium quercuum f. sp. fusiforme G11 TaxID=708437 RepID=A0A9P6NKS2_9BASI|nr:hypothetical protein CROQUDRAFT_93313 [Cronartium quercuum f. sp. fusiforme G11]